MNTFVGGVNALDAVGRPGALYLGDIEQGREGVGFCRDVEVLLALVFVQDSELLYDGWCEQLFWRIFVVELMHVLLFICSAANIQRIFQLSAPKQKYLHHFGVK